MMQIIKIWQINLPCSFILVDHHTNETGKKQESV